MLAALLCAQLFMPAHALDHELSSDPSGTCAICPVGQNLNGVIAEADWLIEPAEPNHFSIALCEREALSAPDMPFHSRAPPFLPESVPTV